MPNPNGTRTRDEHRQAILGRVLGHVMNGKHPDEALTLASAEHKQQIEREADAKVEQVKNWLAGKRPA